MTKKPNIFVVAAPSGTGKTTLNRRLIKDFTTIEFSVSLTTRKIRKGETDGDHYHFVTIEEFKEQVEKDRMLEWAEVFGNTYGTSLDEVDRITKNGKDILLEIDVTGWHYANKRVSGAISIFIIPPSMKALWDRLAGRGTDALEARLQRFETARKEIEKSVEFQHFIVNDDIEAAYDELKNIIIHRKEGQLTREQGLEKCKDLLRECDEADWLEEIKKQLPQK